jgi:hypothetical protein
VRQTNSPASSVTNGKTSNPRTPSTSIGRQKLARRRSIDLRDVALPSRDQ